MCLPVSKYFQESRSPRRWGIKTFDITLIVYGAICKLFLACLSSKIRNFSQVIKCLGTTIVLTFVNLYHRFEICVSPMFERLCTCLKMLLKYCHYRLRPKIMPKMSLESQSVYRMSLKIYFIIFKKKCHFSIIGFRPA